MHDYDWLVGYEDGHEQPTRNALESKGCKILEPIGFRTLLIAPANDVTMKELERLDSVVHVEPNEPIDFP